MRKALLLFSMLVVLTSCEDKNRNVLFREPQPADSPDELAFPKKIRGRYLNPEDSSILMLSDRYIVVSRTCVLAISREDIDSPSGIDPKDDRALLAALKKDGMEGRIRGDSIYGSQMVSDTLFAITSDNRLRKLKGYFFLNTRNWNSSYKVLRMEVDKHDLKFSEVVPGDSMYKYESLTAIEKIAGDSGTISAYYLKPSKKELKKLMKAALFAETASFYKKLEE